MPISENQDQEGPFQKIQVLAKYQKKEPNPIFTAILKQALENDGELTIEDARENLSGETLNKRMWKNLLDRLTAQKYFAREKVGRQQQYARYDDDFYNKYLEEEFIYELTTFGQKVAQQNTFFKPMKGVLEIWMLKEESDLFPHKIVKVLEKERRQENNNFKDTKDFDVNEEQTFDLKNASFRFEKLEEKCNLIADESLILEINADNNNNLATIEDLSFILKDNYDEIITASRLKDLFLEQKHGRNYIEADQVVKTTFDGNTQFERTEYIQKPTIEDLGFDALQLNNVSFNALTEADAQAWRLAWLKENVKDYIFEETSFEKIDYEVWKKFEPYFKLPRLAIATFEDYLEQNSSENFYALMKIQAPQLLNY